MENTVEHNYTNILEFQNISISYNSEKKAIKNINVGISDHSITAIMGPSGCGKSTLLRAVNRMHELYPEIQVEGDILLREKSIFSIPAMSVRRQIGMVFQRPNPFQTMSIFDNVLAGYKINNISLSKSEKNEIVENALRSVALWDEVKDSMNKKGSFLSGGQQQRLCIARAIALKPKVLLMDEPTSALDPVSTRKIEELIVELKDLFSILIVTHNMSQAARISDNSMFMYMGELIEFGDTKQMFTKPKHKHTEEYLTGVFG